eukprot:gene7548-7758_t
MESQLLYDNVVAVRCNSSQNWGSSTAPRDTDEADDPSFWYENSNFSDPNLMSTLKRQKKRARLGTYSTDLPVVNPRRLEWIIFPDDPLIYSGSTFSKCLAAEDIDAELSGTGAPLVGARDRSRLNVYLASCNSSSEWQKWRMINKTEGWQIQLISLSNLTLDICINQVGGCVLSSGLGYHSSGFSNVILHDVLHDGVNQIFAFDNISGMSLTARQQAEYYMQAHLQAQQRCCVSPPVGRLLLPRRFIGVLD